MAGSVETGAVVTGCADEADATLKVSAIVEAGVRFIAGARSKLKTCSSLFFN